MAKWTDISIKLMAAALFMVGGILSVQASWLPAKAWISQQLILYSWQQSKAKYEQEQSNLQYYEHDKARLHGQGFTAPIVIKPWPWADTFPIAELTFQRLDKSIVVLNGGDPTTLAFSAGAIAPFNQANITKPFVVAGHRDSHFAFLPDIAMKDVISLMDIQGRTLLYQVENMTIVDASTGQLPLLADEQSLVLITCYPFQSIGNEADQRYVITAKAL